MKIGDIYKAKITGENFIIHSIEGDNVIVITSKGKFQTNIKTFLKCVEEKEFNLWQHLIITKAQ